jgi:ribonuclease VapC
VVVDTSALLGVLFAEPHGGWVVARLAERAGELRMSTVNLAEALILLQDRQPHLADELEARLLESGIRFVPPDTDQARTAAAARLRYPLNLGDCFAYALAVSERCPILTLDADFRRLDVEVLLPPDPGAAPRPGRIEP